ncbi:Hint domain-containing protein [Streptomyces olivaceoviridis]
MVERNLKPFKEAVASLAVAPGLRYKDTSAYGITENEITVTAGGSQFGTTGNPGRDAKTYKDVLRIGGKTFMRHQVDPALPPEADREGGADSKARPGRWALGMDDGDVLVDEALTRTEKPSKLAADLSKALASLEKDPSPSRYDTKLRKKMVSGTRGLGIDTSAGRLWVTESQPHRVLRLEPYDLRQSISDVEGQMEKGEEPRTIPRVTSGPLASRGSEGFDLVPLSGQDAEKMLDTLVEYAEQLKDATDDGISFSLSGSGDMTCSSAGCRDTERFTGEVSSKAREKRVTDGRVTAFMSARFSIDGKPAGQCTSEPRTFTVKGTSVSGTLTCSNAGAGPLFTSISAAYKNRAEAESRARNGATVRYSIPLTADTHVSAQALAKVEAKKLADLAKSERAAAKCATSHSFPSGTQVLLADGTTRAIEDIHVGDRVAASAPRTGITAARPVTNIFTNEDDKDFTQFTITTEQGPGTITATDNHPFWVANDQQWKEAGELQVGDELRTPDDAHATVTEVRDQQGPQRTHDLTVNDLHTYYVLAGDTPVLVHNSGGCPDLDALLQSGMRPAKGKTTHAGREYQKHMNRGDLPVVPGKELATAGQNLLKDILTNPQTTRSAVKSGNFAGGTRYIMPDPDGGRGIGATFDANGQFQYFGRY